MPHKAEQIKVLAGEIIAERGWSQDDFRSRHARTLGRIDNAANESERLQALADWETLKDEPPPGAGDAWEPPADIAEPVPARKRSGNIRYNPCPISELQGEPGGVDWIWRGLIARGSITLMSALYKVGKTTLLVDLLKTCHVGGDLLGLEVKPARVLYLTEESKEIWIERRDRVGLKDNVITDIRPFVTKPTFPEWSEMLSLVSEDIDRLKIDLVVMDTLPSMWPVAQENDASEVQSALMPLREISEKAGLFLLHHLRKGGGEEYTGSRGSGALPGFADILLELRRFNPSIDGDRKRVLKGLGRWSDTPSELVIERGEDGFYTCHGKRSEARKKTLLDVIGTILADAATQLDIEDLLGVWPDSESKPQRNKLLAALKEGAERRRWDVSGAGKKNDPFRYARIGFGTNP